MNEDSQGRTRRTTTSKYQEEANQGIEQLERPL
jgi:hypothetical protein